jgi:hypothetical protein
VEEADSKLRRWKRLLGYIQLHSTQTNEKIRSKELDDCLYMGRSWLWWASGVSIAGLTLSHPSFRSPTVLPFKRCVSEHQTSLVVRKSLVLV